MTGLLALAPCAVVIVTVLGLGRSSLAAAAAACLTAAAIWISGVFMPAAPVHLARVATDALVLELLVASVLLPGLLFVEITDRTGGPRAIAGAVARLGLGPAPAAILIAAGIGLTLESLTGFGVSMLVSLPLLLGLTGRRKAVALALIGMCLMPWGALGISALLGAALAGIPVPALAAEVLYTSGPVALVLPALCLAFVPGPGWSDLARAALAGLALLAAVAAASRWIGIEVAGVAGGLAVIAVIAATAGGAGQPYRAGPLLSYGFLVAAVVGQKLAVPALAAAGFSPGLDTGRVGFAFLASPGAALLAVSLGVWAAAGRGAALGPVLIFQRVAARSWRALATILLFLLAARLLVECGAVIALSGLLAGLGGHVAVAAVAALGAVGGFVTGSGITGNVLFMPSAAATGASLGAVAPFAAIQHSASGHAAMAALPILAVLLAALPDRTPADDRAAMKTALGLAGLCVGIVTVAGWLRWMAIGG